MTWLRMSLFVLFFLNILVLGLRSGPFKASFLSVRSCPSPTLPVDPDPPCLYSAELYNTSTETNLMRMKCIIVRDFKNLRTIGKRYVWENNKWKIMYIIKSNGCNRVFFPAIATPLGIKYDQATCTFNKGNYSATNYNVDKLIHAWRSSQEYGHILWKLELFTSVGSGGCYEYEVLMEPLPK